MLFKLNFNNNKKTFLKSKHGDGKQSNDGNQYSIVVKILFSFEMQMNKSVNW